tara:strand:+ start:51 stop:1109 length:1059 start_codon:yes stop_codon:yes gene_type:complete
MRVVVTGGAGFIGSALVRHLVGEAGAEVLVIDKLTYAGNLDSLASVAGKPNFHFFRADVTDTAQMAAALASFCPDQVIHLAAESHVDRSIAEASAFIQSNIVGTFSILEAARAYWMGLSLLARTNFRFVHVSTDEVYGSLGDFDQFYETTAYDPSSPYAASKAASDHLAMAWHRTYGLPVVVSNCSNNYGPCQFPEKLIPLMVLNALNGKALPVYGQGQNIRDWLYVDDHVRALVLIASRGRPGRKYNVGGRNEQRNIDVVVSICALMDELHPAGMPHSQLIRFVVDRPGHDERYAIDAGRIERELGWQARENFASGLRKTVCWYLDNEWWWQPLRQQASGGERLGLLKEVV